MTTKIIAILCVILISMAAAYAQTSPRWTGESLLFSVVDGGKTIQPIAKIDKGQIVELGDIGADPKAFAANFYKPKTTYQLIFGGAAAGTVSVVKANYPAECAGNSAESTAVSKSAKLSDAVFALAAGKGVKVADAGYRRRPTVAERTEIESLVRAELKNQKVAGAATQQLRYKNLTAVDVDSDGVPEFIGSYWAAPSEKERDLLFFVASKTAAGTYTFDFSDFAKVTPESIMSGDLNDLDTAGVVHELLLDVLDYDNDGTAEIFTVAKAFEGDNFYVYKRAAGKWSKVFESYNYRCGY